MDATDDRRAQRTDGISRVPSLAKEFFAVLHEIVNRSSERR